MCTAQVGEGLLVGRVGLQHEMTLLRKLQKSDLESQVDPKVKDSDLYLRPTYT